LTHAAQRYLIGFLTSVQGGKSDFLAIREHEFVKKAFMKGQEEDRSVCRRYVLKRKKPSHCSRRLCNEKTQFAVGGGFEPPRGS